MPQNQTSPPTYGETNPGWYKGRKARVLRERVSISNDSLQGLLTQSLPGACQVVWAAVVNQTAVAVDGNDGTSTANAYGLFNIGTLTTLSTATVSNATVSAILTVASTTTALAAAAVVRGTGVGTAALLNTNDTTTRNNLALIPMVVSSNRLYPKSDGFLFNGTAEVDVVVYYEEYSDRGN